MPTAIVTATTAFHIGLGFALVFGFLGYMVRADKKLRERLAKSRRRPVVVKPAPAPESVPDFGFDEVDWAHLKPSPSPEAHVGFGR